MYLSYLKIAELQTHKRYFGTCVRVHFEYRTFTCNSTYILHCGTDNVKYEYFFHHWICSHIVKVYFDSLTPNKKVRPSVEQWSLTSFNNVSNTNCVPKINKWSRRFDSYGYEESTEGENVTELVTFSPETDCIKYERLTIVNATEPSPWQYRWDSLFSFGQLWDDFKLIQCYSP